MHWLDKLLIFLSSLVLVVLGIAFLLSGMGIDFTQSISDIFWMVQGPAALWGIVVGGLLILIGFYLAGRFLGQNQEENVLIFEESEYGKIRISERVVKAYIQKAAKSVDGILDAKVRVKNLDDGLYIVIDTITETDIKTADIAKVVQERVYNYLQETVGTKVAHIEINISGVEAQPKSRLN